MAQKRMFSKSVVESDFFLSMPLTAQALYFHISMLADDDGFCSQTKSILYLTGAREDDLNILLAKGFLIRFEDGVTVVKHWRLNNYLQNDRIHETEYLEDKRKLFIKENKVYTLDPMKGTPLIPMDKKCIQNVSIDKNRLEENRLDKSSLDENRKSEGKGKTSAEVMEEIKRKRKEQNELF